jgi:hypothetical protein
MKEITALPSLAPTSLRRKWYSLQILPSFANSSFVFFPEGYLAIQKKLQADDPRCQDFSFVISPLHCIISDSKFRKFWG